METELGRTAGLRQDLGLQPNYKTSHSHPSLTVVASLQLYICLSPICELDKDKLPGKSQSVK